jgi:hypothetical protein
MKARPPAAIFVGALIATWWLACVKAWAAAPQSAYSAAALYNAANAYARAGKIGLAILFYERAQWLSPRDADIAANLHFVRAAAQLPDSSPGVFERVLTVAGPDAFAWLGVFGMLCIGTGILCRWRLFARRSWSAWLLSGGALCVALTAANVVVIAPRLQAAVVLSAPAPVRATPAPMGDELFEMREGDTVRVEAEHEDFVFVRTAEGREGWVARAGVAFVVPR